MAGDLRLAKAYLIHVAPSDENGDHVGALNAVAHLLHYVTSHFRLVNPHSQARRLQQLRDGYHSLVVAAASFVRPPIVRQENVVFGHCARCVGSGAGQTGSGQEESE